MREGEIQRNIIEYLKLAGYLVFRMNAGKARSNISLAPAGTPDILAVGREGETVWVECKTAKGRANKEQLRMHGELMSRGHTVTIARCVEDVKEVIDD